MKHGFLVFSILAAIPLAAAADPSLTNPNATSETKALYHNLAKLGDQVLFGHEDSLAYGTKWWGYNEDGSIHSDIKAVTGSFPAVFGADIGGIGLGHDKNLDGVKFSDYVNYIKETFKMGGVNTISWHMYSPVDQSNSWSKIPYVQTLIPDGEHHNQLTAYLDAFIAFNETLKLTVDESEIWIPVIFRPWHEHNGDWFWWGKGHTSEQDYIALWQYTVDYLNNNEQNNLIYAFSPDRSRIDMANFEQSYQYGYPGDNYIDIIGYDNYWDLGHPANQTSVDEQQALFVEGLANLTELAESKGKISALSEAGQEGVWQENFWTERFAAGIFASDKTSRVAYALVWRNNNEEQGKKGHYYGSYPEEVNANDFVEFYNNPKTVFINNIPVMYK
ncbi:glycoside hydrolase family 26 protein [Photobacterium sp. DNB23_23_1]